MLHHLKTLPTFYQATIDGRKPFEIRNNDRNFQSGDDLILNEWESGEYTGRFCAATIKDVFDISFLLPGHVAFTFTLLGNYEEMQTMSQHSTAQHSTAQHRTKANLI